MTSSAACARISAAAACTAPKQARRQFDAQRSAAGKRCSSASPPPPPSTSPRTPLPSRLSRPSPSSTSPVAARAFFDGSRDNGEAAATAASGGDDDGGSRALLAYSQAVTADDVEFFTRAAPADVVGAMTETVSGLLGSLACSAVANAASRAGGGGGGGGGSSPFPASAAAAVASSSSMPSSLSSPSSSSSSSSSSAPAFDVRVRARDADLGQLLYSTLMTGYLMRNAASRLRLRSRLSAGAGSAAEGAVEERGGGGAALLPAAALPPSPSPSQPLVLPPSPSSSEEEEPSPIVDPTTLPPDARAAALASLEGTPRLAPGAQTSKVEGDVLKWDQNHGLVSVPAAAYIRALEAELANARRASVTAAASAAASEKESDARGAGVALSTAAKEQQLPPPPPPAPSSPLSNPLLSFLRSADEASLTSLTAEASPGVLEAANAFVQRIMTGGENARENASLKFGAGGYGISVGGGGNGRSGSSSSAVVREYRASELRHLLLFVMVVGFMLRTLEARLDIEFSMLLPPAVLEVGGGRGDAEDEEYFFFFFFFFDYFLVCLEIQNLLPCVCFYIFSIVLFTPALPCDIPLYVAVN